jgi:hypothetical protein
MSSEVMPEITLSDRGVTVSTRGESPSYSSFAAKFSRYHGSPNESVKAFFGSQGGSVVLAPVELRLIAEQLHVLADALDAAEVIRRRVDTMERLKSPSDGAGR